MKMKHLVTSVMLVATMAMLVPGLSQTGEILNNKSVVDLQKAGLTKQVIISKIETSACRFDLSTDGLVALKKANINDDIIQAMMYKANSKPSNHGLNAPSQEKSNAAKKEVPVPENINEINAYYRSTNSIKPLEKARATMKTKSKMFGYGGTKTLYSVDGAVSTFRLLNNDSVSFIVNTGAAAPDFILYRLETDKKTRAAVGGTVKMGKVEGASGVIAYTTVQLKQGVYQLTLSIKLEKGEYFFGTAPTLASNTMDVYAFGID